MTISHCTEAVMLGSLELSTYILTYAAYLRLLDTLRSLLTYILCYETI